MVLKNLSNISKELLEGLVNPFLPKFNLTDVLQIVIGASILAVPVGFTEETWKLGESLPWINVFGLLALSLFFIILFTQFQYHKNGLKKSWPTFVKRVFFTYVLSFLVVAVIMTLIQRAPWQTDWALAIKRIIVVTFPSTMSAVVADTFR
jgi:uncharacterized membrane protein